MDLRVLVAEGDLDAAGLTIDLPDEWVDFPGVQRHKTGLLHRAAARFFAAGTQGRKEEFWSFCDANNWWLDDYALFMALKEYFGGKSWNRWPDSVVQRDAKALEEYSRQLGPNIGESWAPSVVCWWTNRVCPWAWW